jgi:hypothetical protein
MDIIAENTLIRWIALSSVCTGLSARSFTIVAGALCCCVSYEAVQSATKTFSSVDDAMLCVEFCVMSYCVLHRSYSVWEKLLSRDISMTSVMMSQPDPSDPTSLLAMIF